MAWYRPLQRKDGKWDYTCTNSAGTFPLGYCHAYRPMEPDAGMFPPSVCEAENARIAPFKDKYHDTGHRTADAAIACHREYELDQRLKFEPGENSKEQHKCGICEAWTTGKAYIHGEFMRHWELCDAHRTREFVEKLWELD